MFCVVNRQLLAALDGAFVSLVGRPVSAVGTNLSGTTVEESNMKGHIELSPSAHVPPVYNTYTATTD